MVKKLQEKKEDIKKCTKFKPKFKQFTLRIPDNIFWEIQIKLAQDRAKLGKFLMNCIEEYIKK